MKLHLPCKLLAAVLACLCACTSFTLGQDEAGSSFSPTRISVNYGDAIGADTTSSVGLAPAGEWNNVGNGGEDTITDSSGREYALVTSGGYLTSSGAGLWNNGNSVVDVETALLHGYLDLFNSGTATLTSANHNWTINLDSDLLYSRASLYMSNDATNSQYLPVCVNGEYYIGGTDNKYAGSSDLTTLGGWTNDDLWGSTGSKTDNVCSAERTSISDDNTVSVTIVGGALSANNTTHANASGTTGNQGRTTIAGFQVVDMAWYTDGTEIDAATATYKQFSDTAATGYVTGGLDDIAAGCRYLGFTDGQTVNFGSGTAPDGIQATSGTVTIQQRDGTAGVSLPVLFARKDATLKVANDMFAPNTNVLIQGAGVVEFASLMSASGGTYTVAGGTLKVTANGTSNGFVKGNVIVDAGGKLWLTKTDNLGYWADYCTPNVILRGEEGNVAMMQVDERQTTTTVISMEGYAEISGTATNSQIQTYGATDSTAPPLIKATNVGNVISTKLSLDHNVTIQVGELTGTGNTAEGAELTLSGQVTGYNGGNKILTKTGLGTLIVTQVAPNDNVSYAVNGGTLRVTTDDSSGKAFTRKNVNVNAGGTLLLVNTDAMGYDGDRVKTITLTGAQGNEAMLKMGARQTLQSNIVMQGHSVIAAANALTDNLTLKTDGDAPSLNPFSNSHGAGSITVSGTNNTISAKIALRDALTINVASAGELTITGDFFSQTDGSSVITKAGAGKLMIGVAGTTDTAGTAIDGSHGLLLSGGEVVNNRTLTILHLTTEAGTTFTNNGALTLTGTVILGAAITNNDGATITFGSNGKLDITDMVYTTSLTEEGKTQYNYSMLTAGSLGTVSAMTTSNIAGVVTDGKSWIFNTDGTFSYTLNAKNLVCDTTSMTWTTGDIDGVGSFDSGDSVTFRGESSATLGGNISSSGITVVDGATVTIAEGDAEGNRVLAADSVTVEAGGALELSGSAMLSTSLLTIEGAVMDGDEPVTAAGKLTMTGTELAAGTKVQGTGTLVLKDVEDTKNYDGVVDEFEGDLELASGTYKHHVEGEWDKLNSLTVTGTGKALFFGQGTGGDYTGDIYVKELSEGHKEALKLDGGEVRGTVNITQSVNIYNQWAGELYSSVNGEGNVTFTGEDTLNVGSDFSSLTGDIIVDKAETTTFKGTLNGVQGSYDGSSTGVELKATLSNTGKFIVKRGTANVYSAISSTEGVEVESGAVLNVNDIDQANDFTLKGGTVNLAGSSLVNEDGGGTVTLETTSGSSIISGNNAVINHAIDGSGNLTLKSVGNGENQKLYVCSEASFSGDLLVTAGAVEFGRENQPAADVHNSGDVNISGGSLTVNSGTTVNNGGSINVRGGSLALKEGSIIGSSITAQTGNATGGYTPVATFSAIAAAAEASVFALPVDPTYANVTITNSGIVGGTGGGSVADARVTVTGAFSISDVTFSNSQLVEGAGAELTCSNVMLEGTTNVTLSSLENGKTNFLSGMELLGELNLDLSSDLIAEIVGSINASQSPFDITFTNFDTTTHADVVSYSVSDNVRQYFELVTWETAAEGANLVATFTLKAPAAIPEPATATLSLLALAALAARRRRK